MKNLIRVIQIGFVVLLFGTTSYSQDVILTGNKYFKDNVFYPRSDLAELFKNDALALASVKKAGRK